MGRWKKTTELKRRIVDYLAEAEGFVPLRKIANELGLAESTASRLCRALYFDPPHRLARRHAASRKGRRVEYRINEKRRWEPWE